MSDCACRATCGDSDPDGPGVCKGLPREPEPPLVEVVLVPRAHWTTRLAWEAGDD